MASRNVDVGWPLDKYALYIGQVEQEKCDWQIHDGPDLLLMVTSEHHLMVVQDTHIKENLSLWGCRMKAMTRNDAMMFIQEVNDKHRKFRVKFKSRDSCQNAAKQLRSYFNIQCLDESTNQDAKVQLETSEPEIFVGDIAKKLLEEGNLPSVYQESVIPSTGLKTLIKLCLTDSNFPAFVGQVEKEMKQIMKDAI